MKSLLLSCIFAVILFSSLPVFYILSTVKGEDGISLQNAKVVYNLPYPGLLPDNPVYFLKASRDKLVEFFTRDNVKKARLYLNYSDKRISMAIKLADKGEHKLSLTTVSKAEKYFIKIPDLLKESKKQGAAPPQELILQLKQSNLKHKEIIDTMLKDFPQGEKESFDQIIKMNLQITEQLNELE